MEGGEQQIGRWSDGVWNINQSAITTISNGVLFDLNLHQPFNISDKNAPALFVTLAETQISNYYVDGAMFADYNEFYAWG